MNEQTRQKFDVFLNACLPVSGKKCLFLQQTLLLLFNLAVLFILEGQYRLGEKKLNM